MPIREPQIESERLTQALQTVKAKQTSLPFPPRRKYLSFLTKTARATHTRTHDYTNAMHIQMRPLLPTREDEFCNSEVAYTHALSSGGSSSESALN